MKPTLRVLYIEDEADIRAVAEIALEDEGFELVPCASGQEAISKGASGDFDLLLIDVMMPGMDGPSTLEKLRLMTHLAQTPAIFMTAKVQPSEIKEYQALGAIGVIAKPFDAMSLGDQIRAVLQAREGSDHG